VLSRQDIIEAIERGDVTFDPEIDIQTSVEQVSVDLRLGRKFTRFRELAPHVPALYVEASVFEHSELWDVVEGDTCRLEPGELVLAQTLEYVTLPNYLMGLVEGRSSWGRMGITRHDKPAQLMLIPVSTPLDSDDTYGPKDRFFGQRGVIRESKG